MPSPNVAPFYHQSSDEAVSYCAFSVCSIDITIRHDNGNEQYNYPALTNHIGAPINTSRILDSWDDHRYQTMLPLRN